MDVIVSRPFSPSLMIVNELQKNIDSILPCRTKRSYRTGANQPYSHTVFLRIRMALFHIIGHSGR
jgi:hypothetical protein